MSTDLDERWEEMRPAADSPALFIELLRDFVRDFPDFGPGWIRLGMALRDVALYDESEGALQRALELTETEYLHTVYTELGNIFRDRGDTATAGQWFRRAIDHSPSDASAYVYFGAMLARVGRLAEAERLHRRGTGCEAGFIDEAYLNLGLVLRAQGRYEEAVECFELALAIDPDYEAARDASRDVVKAMRVRAERR